MIKDDVINMYSKLSPVNQFKLITLSLLIIFLFAKPILNLTHVWINNADYSHGFFVIPVSLFMVWQKRKTILSTPAKASWAGFPLFLAGSVLYLIAVITKFHSLTFFSMIAVLLSLTLFLAGYKITKILLLPILFLVFMFPIPSAYYVMITNPLKLMITDISAHIIKLLGIPVYQDGNLLFFANTSLEVAEACSGIRSLYSYLMLSFVLSIFCKKKVTKIVLICSTIPLAIFVNIMRVAGTGILSHFYGAKVAQGFFQEFTGFLLFGIGFVFLFIEYYFFEKTKNVCKQS